MRSGHSGISGNKLKLPVTKQRLVSPENNRNDVEITVRLSARNNLGLISEFFMDPAGDTWHHRRSVAEGF